MILRLREAAKLPAAEQEFLASRLLAELAAEDDFDRAIAGSVDKLARLAAEARLSGKGTSSPFGRKSGELSMNS